jgi:hypothetical protein
VRIVRHFHLIKDVPIFWWHAWGSVVFPLLEYLGILGILFSVIVLIVRYIEHRWKRRTHREAISDSKQYFRDIVGTPLIAFVGLFLISGISLGPYKWSRHFEDDSKQSHERISQLEQSVKELQEEVDFRKHNLRTTDPVFSNLMYLMRAFQTYRHAIGGDAVSCTVRITVPPGNQSEIARTVGQFSVGTSNCSTFGPMDMGGSPDERKDALDGMVPNAIILHAARDDKSANQLSDQLRSLFRLERSFDIPKGSPHNFVWLSLDQL